MVCIGGKQNYLNASSGGDKHTTANHIQTKRPPAPHTPMQRSHIISEQKESQCYTMNRMKKLWFDLERLFSFWSMLNKWFLKEIVNQYSTKQTGIVRLKNLVSQF